MALSAGVAAIAEQIAGGNFLDLLKVQKQRHYTKSYTQLARQLGVAGAWRGMWPWGVGMYGSRGFVFGAGHRAAQRALEASHPDAPARTVAVAASAAGGALEGAVTSPFATMRTRVLQEMERGGRALPRPTAAQLLRPAPPYALKRALDWSLRGALYGGGGGDNEPSLLRAAAAGAASTLVTMPLDRVLPVLQQHGRPPAGWWKDSLRAGGLRSVMAGAAARVAHGAWHTLFVFTALHHAPR